MRTGEGKVVAFALVPSRGCGMNTAGETDHAHDTRELAVMDDTRVGRWLGYGFFATALCLGSCAPKPIAVEELPTAEATLANVGRRLSQTNSADALTRIARAKNVLARLTAEEPRRTRSVLAPFSSRIARQSFSSPIPGVRLRSGSETKAARSELTLDVGEPKQIWDVATKVVNRGVVGLGVNGLDQTAEGHYCVFLRAQDGSEMEPALVEDDGRWRVIRATEASSLASEAALPVRQLPSELAGAGRWLLQPRHDMRHATVLARGRVWKTHVVAGRKPDQVTVAFGQDASRELTWSWRTSTDVAGAQVRIWREGSSDEKHITGTSLAR